jgi:hypothetical protein
MKLRSKRTFSHSGKFLQNPKSPSNLSANMLKQELSLNTNTSQYTQALFCALVAFLEKQAYIKNDFPIGTGKGLGQSYQSQPVHVRYYVHAFISLLCYWY